MSSCSSFIFLFILTFLFISNASAQSPLYTYCPNTTTYSRNSTYFTNLRTLLSSLSYSNASYSTGFQNATAGQAPDMVTGLFLCRGDVTPKVCRSCVAFSVNQSLLQCPEQREAALYYEECILRYSNQNILQTPVYRGGYILMNPNNISSNQAPQFEDLVSSKMNEAANEAANSSRKFYTTKANWTTLQTLYVLVQCTPDLRRVDCLTCLQQSINAMSLNSVGGRLLFPSCLSRYELYPFYNETTIGAPSPPSSPTPTPPVPSTPPGEFFLID